MAEISRSRNNQQSFPSDPLEADFSARRDKPTVILPAKFRSHASHQGLPQCDEFCSDNGPSSHPSRIPPCLESPLLSLSVPPSSPTPYQHYLFWMQSCLWSQPGEFFWEKKNVSGEGTEEPGVLHPFLSTLTADQSSGELQYWRDLMPEMGRVLVPRMALNTWKGTRSQFVKWIKN